MKWRRRLAIVFACLALGPGVGPADGQQPPAPPPDEKAIQDALEPASRLRAVAFQNNFDFGIGPADRTGYRLLFQPWQAEVGRGRWLRVKSFSAVPMLYLPDPFRPEGGTFGLGDPEISLFWSPAKTGTAVLGLGPIVRFPLASDEALGSGKWAAGVSAIAVIRPRGWLLGVRSYNVWSFAGDETRDDVNQFLLVPLVVRVLGNGWYLVSSPVITADWKAQSGDQWLVPVGGGAGRLFRMGGRGLDLQLQAFYNVVHPETLPHADWTLRFQLQFLFKS